MPRISPTGEVVQGLGLVWWKPVVSQELIGQREQPDGSWAVSTAPTTAGPWTVLDHRGCNFIAAGGSNWAAFGGTIFGPAAVPGAAVPAGLDGRGAGAPDGTILLVKNSETGGLMLAYIDGSVLELPDAWPTSNACVIDRNRALWVDARGGVRTCGGLPVPLTLPGPVLWPAVFWAQEQWWIAYHSTDAIGYVCHPFTSTDGYPIARIPAFYPNAVALSDQTARFAWSVDPSESPAGLRVWNQSLTAPRVPLGGIVPPEPPIVPPVDFPPLFPLEHPMEPFAAAFQIGVHVARVDRQGTAPWPEWFPIRFDRTDTADPDTHFTVSQPESGNPRLMVTASGGGFLTADFTEFGGSVCDGFYCSPEALGWGGYQQWNGWTLGTNGPELVLVQYQDPARAGQCSPSLTVVRL